MWNKRSAGVTLIELIVAIVIMAIALAGMVAVFTRTDRASVDPVISQQMAIVAEGMMEEILLKPFGTDANPAPAQRSLFAKVQDYNGYARNGIVDVEGNAVAGLESYGVQVAVLKTVLAQVPDTKALKIRITVVHAGAPDFVLTGWRTSL
jgi:MSHA pilin protein MshD